MKNAIEDPVSSDLIEYVISMHYVGLGYKNMCFLNSTVLKSIIIIPNLMKIMVRKRVEHFLSFYLCKFTLEL